MQWFLRLGIHWPHKVFVTLEKKLTSLHYKRAPIYSRLKTLGLSCYIIQDHNAFPKSFPKLHGKWEVCLILFLIDLKRRRRFTFTLLPKNYVACHRDFSKSLLSLFIKLWDVIQLCLFGILIKDFNDMYSSC